MTGAAIRALLERVNVSDPHEFATEFARYVDATGDTDVTRAIQRWISSGKLT